MKTSPGEAIAGAGYEALSGNDLDHYNNRAADIEHQVGIDLRELSRRTDASYDAMRTGKDELEEALVKDGRYRTYTPQEPDVP